ncbi:DUF3558 family protein [Actinoplanes couchii]|uniref:DUF3558 domain-containing protein n=1 Tax=Actinoplanes couchii TaxID=403638 RepID=A0ABQ3XH47_9ACTN|nr:DUF3558 family protein [Actinoplanes couchii]MDR6320719.1 hypothetical protein [Actinoplanes couchii]GID57796.1 hypothetical protein Aco03nite_062000 [Actinoplanes couchii]
MKHRLAALTAVVAVALTSGCGALGDAAAGSAPDLAGASPTPATSPAETTGGTTGTDIPDPCTLLTKAEVTGLTSREVTQIDEDGGAEGARFCQWQQSGGQLAIFLAESTPADFQVRTADAERVDGIGEDAFWATGHLYVLQGTTQLDVYSRGADPESGNLTDAKAVAKVVLERLK